MLNVLEEVRGNLEKRLALLAVMLLCVAIALGGSALRMLEVAPDETDLAEHRIAIISTERDQQWF